MQDERTPDSAHGKIIVGQNDVKDVNQGMLVKPVALWKDFIDFVADPHQCSGPLVYRGQADASWKVTSTIDRLERRFPERPNLRVDGVPLVFGVPRVSRKVQLNRFKEMARGKLAFLIPDEDEDEWWAIAQHHGLATPMLDWCYSPFVALYFAFEEEKCICENDWKNPKNRAVFALSHHLIAGAEEGKECPRPYAPRAHGNFRLTNQSGLLLRMPEGRDLEAYVQDRFADQTYSLPGSHGRGNDNPSLVLVKFVIPDNDRVGCLRFLDYMNINRASLFPDLDGAAQYVNNLWEVNFDKAIGYINEDF